MNRPNTLAGALLLGIGSIALVFLLGEGVHVPAGLPGAALRQVVVFLAPQGVGAISSWAEAKARLRAAARRVVSKRGDG